MDVETARGIDVNPRVSKGLEYGSILVVLGASLLFFQSQFLLGGVVAVGGVLGYQVAKYRQAVAALQKSP